VPRAALRRPDLVLRHHGHEVWCPLCRVHFRSFKDDWNRANALCWLCGSHERHRALWLLFEQRPDLLSGRRALLHFAPEYCLRVRLTRAANREGFRYDTTDLDPNGVELQLDITALDLPDDEYDAVLCSHVLEHVLDDGAAIRELRRVTAPNGWCLVMVPIDVGREATYEDAAIATPEERRVAYWQHDHVRLYGRDVVQRLTKASFSVEAIRPREAFGEEVVRRARLLESDWMLLCR
jgi:SAM-dependent methyltransferase